MHVTGLPSRYSCGMVKHDASVLQRVTLSLLACSTLPPLRKFTWVYRRPGSAVHAAWLLGLGVLGWLRLCLCSPPPKHHPPWSGVGRSVPFRSVRFSCVFLLHSTKTGLRCICVDSMHCKCHQSRQKQPHTKRIFVARPDRGRCAYPLRQKISSVHQRQGG